MLDIFSSSVTHSLICGVFVHVCSFVPFSLWWNNPSFLFQFVIDNQVLPCLYQLLTQNHKKSIKKEACWTISNITAGNKGQIQVQVSLNFYVLDENRFVSNSIYVAHCLAEILESFHFACISGFFNHHYLKKDNWQFIILVEWKLLRLNFVDVYFLDKNSFVFELK